MSVITRILSIDRDEPDPAALEEAAGVIHAGGLVAFATETVYGLGADATNPSAVEKVFSAKGRPTTNPLIVHVADREMAWRCTANWEESAELLAEAFWPGPLTLVLPRSGIIPDDVTCGLETVGVRVPEPLVARRLIQVCDRPIAAPSANRSSRISPTRAAHVHKDLNGSIDLILDSGPTQIGIESTVLDLTTRHPHILRPGMISRAEIEHVLGGLRVLESNHVAEGVQRSPGRSEQHYAPQTRAVLVEPSELSRVPWPSHAALVLFDDLETSEIPPCVVRCWLANPIEAARDLYSTLHELDERGLELIVIVAPPDNADWHALRDRVRRASVPWPGVE